MNFSRLVVINKREVFAQSDVQVYALFGVCAETGRPQLPKHMARMLPFFSY